VSSSVFTQWKAPLALLSLLLAGLIWLMGLSDSLSRKSVAPVLTLQQQELTVLAEPAMPASLRPLLATPDPRTTLLKALEASSEEQRSPRQNRLLGLLRGELAPEGDTISVEVADPLLDQLVCEVSATDPLACINAAASSQALLRLLISALLPLLTAGLGLILLLVKGYQGLRRRLPEAPPLQGPALTLIDMALLVAGGFVVVSSIAVPLIAQPLLLALPEALTSPRREGVSVVFTYALMALPSLLILRRQLTALRRDDRPVDGWLQWRIQPVVSAIRQALSGWLMITPVVMLAGWLLVKVFGDPGGSNPLLELVLLSRDPLALILLSLTAVVLAPLFEEVIFRGVLLPVLARRVGFTAGALLNGLLFAMAHISIGELIPLTVLGTGLALVRLRSGRLLPCVLMHAVWNAVTFANLLLL
tara:strand:+ start:12452 stop:13708 length:1257 start_codon:yes stop_codon:yes gene_type:complete